MNNYDITCSRCGSLLGEYDTEGGVYKNHKDGEITSQHKGTYITDDKSAGMLWHSVAIKCKKCGQLMHASKRLWPA